LSEPPRPADLCELVFVAAGNLNAQRLTAVDHDHVTPGGSSIALDVHDDIHHAVLHIRTVVAQWNDPQKVAQRLASSETAARAEVEDAIFVEEVQPFIEFTAVEVEAVARQQFANGILFFEDGWHLQLLGHGLEGTAFQASKPGQSLLRPSRPPYSIAQ